MSEKRLFLLDAYALIYRSYYAFIKNPRINSKGMNTSAIFGFVNTLEELLRKENPSHIAVGFDPAGPTFRHEAFEQYKAQREETPEAIRQSVPVIKEIISAYRIPVVEVPGFEADDVIGTLAKLAEKEGFDTYMMTPDKDYGQLVSPRIFMYKPKFGGDFEVLGVEEVLKRFSITSPEQVIDILGLMGDASDNIPGCPGVGEKTAIKLVGEFGSIENLLENTDRLKGALKSKIESNREQIRFSKFLATIRTDVPVTFDEKALLREEVDEQKIRKIFEELEFRSLADRVLGRSVSPTAVAPEKKKEPVQGSLFGSLFDAEPQQDAPTAVLDEPTTLASLQTTPHTYHLVTEQAQISALVQQLETASEFAFDTETTGVDPIREQLVGFSFACR